MYGINYNFKATTQKKVFDLISSLLDALKLTFDL